MALSANTHNALAVVAGQTIGGIPNVGRAFPFLEFTTANNTLIYSDATGIPRALPVRSVGVNGTIITRDVTVRVPSQAGVTRSLLDVIRGTTAAQVGVPNDNGGIGWNATSIGAMHPNTFSHIPHNFRDINGTNLWVEANNVIDLGAVALNDHNQVVNAIYRTRLVSFVIDPGTHTIVSMVVWNVTVQVTP
jgi:hypothetical protein